MESHKGRDGRRMRFVHRFGGGDNIVCVNDHLIDGGRNWNCNDCASDVDVVPAAGGGVWVADIAHSPCCPGLTAHVREMDNPGEPAGEDVPPFIPPDAPPFVRALLAGNLTATTATTVHRFGTDGYWLSGDVVLLRIRPRRKPAVRLSL